MNVAHGIVFVAHLVASLAATVILVVMRAQAKGRISASTGTHDNVPRNMAARLFHLIPLTGVAVIATSGGDISWSAAWVLSGVIFYVVGAFILEARALPAERRNDNVTVVRYAEWSLVLLALAALAMLIQFS